MASSTDFSGKTALVTGSSSGIGEEIVIHFAKYGAQVVVTGRNEENISSVVGKCNKVSPTKLEALGIKCDIHNDEDVKSLVNKVVDTFGGLDILVNNAGVATFARITNPAIMDHFDTIVKTNLRAPFLFTNLLAPHLIKSKGNIVNISSIAALHPFDMAPALCAAKAGLDMFTKCLAIDLGPKGVRVNSVNPAATRTPMATALGATSDMWSGFEKKCMAEYPLRRIGEAEDIAKMVLFLASNDASFVTGLIAQVDGGAIHTMTGVTPDVFN